MHIGKSFGIIVEQFPKDMNTLFGPPSQPSSSIKNAGNVGKEQDNSYAIFRVAMSVFLAISTISFVTSVLRNSLQGFVVSAIGIVVLHDVIHLVINEEKINTVSGQLAAGAKATATFLNSLKKSALSIGEEKLITPEEAVAKEEAKNTILRPIWQAILAQRLRDKTS